jgi:hypothetical protein
MVTANVRSNIWRESYLAGTCISVVPPEYRFTAHRDGGAIRVLRDLARRWSRSHRR